MLDGQPQDTGTRNLCHKILKVLSLISYQINISKITQFIAYRIDKKREILFVCDREMVKGQD